MKPNLFRDLYRHMEWADATVWSAVLGAPAASADTRIRDWLYHIHIVQRAFHSVWRGEPVDFNGTQDLSGPALAAWGGGYHC